MREELRAARAAWIRPPTRLPAGLVASGVGPLHSCGTTSEGVRQYRRLRCRHPPWQQVDIAISRVGMEGAMKVKAAMNLEVGGRLVIDDLEIGDPGPTHVLAQQFATGVCRHDGLRRRGALGTGVPWGLGGRDRRRRGRVMRPAGGVQPGRLPDHRGRSHRREDRLCKDVRRQPLRRYRAAMSTPPLGHRSAS